MLAGAARRYGYCIKCLRARRAYRVFGLALRTQLPPPPPRGTAVLPVDVPLLPLDEPDEDEPDEDEPEDADPELDDPLDVDPTEPELRSIPDELDVPDAERGRAEPVERVVPLV